MTQRTWSEIVAADPGHSARYVDRWARMIADGVDVDGEARLVDAIAPRGARILDAGCGQGRLGGYLAARGHDVTGVDLDPVLVDAARARYPGPRWQVADLAGGDYDEGPFDVVVSAGNVLAFVAPDDRRAVLAALRSRLRPGGDGRDAGRLLVGFGLDRGWDLEAFTADAAAAGLAVEQRWSTWDLRPLETPPGFLVALLVAAETRPDADR